MKKRVGVLPKDTTTGPFAEDWKQAFKDASKEVEEIDISPALSSAAFSIKDTDELVGYFLRPQPQKKRKTKRNLRGYVCWCAVTNGIAHKGFHTKCIESL